MNGHSILIKNGEDTYIRTGAAYKLHLENRIADYSILLDVVARDIIEIGGKCPPCRNNSNDIQLLLEIKRRLFDINLGYTWDNDLTALLITIFDFGYMRGAKAVRSKKASKSCSKRS